MVLPDSHRAPRTPCYSGARPEGIRDVAYAAVTLCGRPFAGSFRYPFVFSPSVRGLSPLNAESHDPSQATPTGLALARFRLFPLRSPLLRESLMLSLPPGTEMVHFPGFARAPYEFRRTSHPFRVRGSPIRKSTDHGMCAPPRRLSQLTTSFFAFTRLGIHRVPFLACHSN